MPPCPANGTHNPVNLRLSVRHEPIEQGNGSLTAIHRSCSRWPAAIRAAFKGFTLPPAADAARAKVQEWAQQLGSKKLDNKKETELPGFVQAWRCGSEAAEGRTHELGSPAA